jgi:hypothetical protein
MAGSENLPPTEAIPAESTSVVGEATLREVTMHSANPESFGDVIDTGVGNSPIEAAWKRPEAPEHPQGAEIRRQVSSCPCLA